MSDGASDGATTRVLHAHTGAEWEAGRTQPRNGPQIAGREDEVSDGTMPEQPVQGRV